MSWDQSIGWRSWRHRVDGNDKRQANEVKHVAFDDVRLRTQLMMETCISDDYEPRTCSQPVWTGTTHVQKAWNWLTWSALLYQPFSIPPRLPRRLSEALDLSRSRSRVATSPRSDDGVERRRSPSPSVTHDPSSRHGAPADLSRVNPATDWGTNDRTDVPSPHCTAVLIAWPHRLTAIYLLPTAPIILANSVEI